MQPSTLTIILTLCFLFFSTQNIKAQNSDSTELANLSADLDALFANEEDSLSLFSLIDSILSMPSHNHEMSIRLGYSSRVTTSGRDFGIDQQGISPGVSYYHKSGLYGDVTGVWNSELDPKYYLTIATIGYLGSIKDKWSYSASLDHSFYHSSDSTDTFPLTNSLSGTLSYDFKFAYTGLNYSYYFGDESAHQFTWNLTGVIKKKGFKPFKSVSFLPTLSIVWGNQTLTYKNIQGTVEFIKDLSNQEIVDYFYKQEADRNEVIALRIAREKAAPIIGLRNDLNEGTRLSRQQRYIVNQFANRLQTDIDSFGLLNYYISLPISLSTNKFNILASYNYNIPKKLSESVLNESKANSYFSLTFSYNLGF